MLTVVLLAALFSVSSGEVISVKTLGYETKAQCEEARADVLKFEAPVGYKVYASCVTPSAVVI